MLPDDVRPDKITQIGKEDSANSGKSLADRFQVMRRDCRLGDFHMMVISSERSIDVNQ